MQLHCMLPEVTHFFSQLSVFALKSSGLAVDLLKHGLLEDLRLVDGRLKAYEVLIGRFNVLLLFTEVAMKVEQSLLLVFKCLGSFG